MQSLVLIHNPKRLIVELIQEIFFTLYNLLAQISPKKFKVTFVKSNLLFQSVQIERLALTLHYA